MDQRAFLAMLVVGCSSAAELATVPDGSVTTDDGRGPNYSLDASTSTDDAPPTTDDAPPAPATQQIAVTLIPDGVSGTQRVNFAVPFPPGTLSDATQLRVVAGDSELPSARRVLARYADSSARSVQLQVDVDVSTTTNLTVDVGVAGASASDMADVRTTLAGSGNNVHPKVWALLPAEWLASSGVAGPITPRSAVQGTSLDAWHALCDYDAWDTDAFLTDASATREVWLFDRTTAMYRGYAITGALSPLRSAYREATLYLAGMTISNGVATAIAPPSANDDLKYYYSQGMALHYLLTGDDRYREAAEAVSARVVTMWNPQYNGADRFWTERHAGFALLAHEWAAIVSDDKAATIAARSDTAVAAYLSGMMQYPAGYSDQDARCFAHSATAHGESFGYNGCSPWMSAILADGLDAYARRVGGTKATQVRAALARLGRIIARDGRDSNGKPYYWMGVGTTSHEVDDYDEHWGEAVYIMAMAWDATGRTETSLKSAIDQTLAGMIVHGEVGRVRSFNWQCRSAVMTPTFLR
jgi:hypothetical protein